jgi:DNA primase
VVVGLGSRGMIDLPALHALLVALGPKELASRAGFVVDRRGRGCCPLCSTKNSEAFSLAHRGEIIVAHCFACGWSGDALDLLGRINGTNQFREKLREAQDILGMPQQHLEIDAFDAAPERIDTQTYHNVITALRASCLQFRPILDVCEYLESRCLLDMAAEFGLFALPKREHQYVVIAELTATFGVETLGRCGLLRQGRDGRYMTRELQWSQHRLCIPWLARDGRIDALQRRKLGDWGKPKYIFPAGIAPTQPFGCQLLRAGDARPVALVEGALDVVALTKLCRLNGIDRVALGMPGVDGWRESWSSYLQGRDTYVATDNDEAGDSFQLEIVGDITRFFRWRPIRKDWGEELCKQVKSDS